MGEVAAAGHHLVPRQPPRHRLGRPPQRHGHRRRAAFGGLGPEHPDGISRPEEIQQGLHEPIERLQREVEGEPFSTADSMTTDDVLERKKEMLRARLRTRQQRGPAPIARGASPVAGMTALQWSVANVVQTSWRSTIYWARVLMT